MCLKEESYGGCQVSTIGPLKNTKLPKVLNVVLSFEEGLKFNLALDECLRQLNSYNRATKEGKRAAICLAVKPQMNRIDIVEGKIKI